jgi:hypothetical protein
LKVLRNFINDGIRWKYNNDVQVIGRVAMVLQRLEGAEPIGHT